MKIMDPQPTSTRPGLFMQDEFFGKMMMFQVFPEIDHCDCPQFKRLNRGLGATYRICEHLIYLKAQA